MKRILNARKKSVETGEGIDYATGEALAYGSLALEGYHVRVSGQDVERGTFSQRHAVLHDQNSESVWTPLSNLSEDQGAFNISNSSLSEYGVLGFEYGYSLTSQMLWLNGKLNLVISPTLPKLSLINSSLVLNRNGNKDLVLFCHCHMVTMVKVQNIPHPDSKDTYNYVMKINVSSHHQKN